jgi:Leucine-rich repeat (LRR) protein
MKKRFWGIVGLLLLCLWPALVACDSDADGEVEAGVKRSIATNAAVSEDAPELPPEYITIRGKRRSTSLTELALTCAELTSADIEPLKYMSSLTTLRLDHNKIGDIGALSGLTNLTDLEVRGNPLAQSQIDALLAALPNCDSIGF